MTWSRRAFLGVCRRAAYAGALVGWLKLPGTKIGAVGGTFSLAECAPKDGGSVHLMTWVTSTDKCVREGHSDGHWASEPLTFADWPPTLPPDPLHFRCAPPTHIDP